MSVCQVQRVVLFCVLVFFKVCSCGGRTLRPHLGQNITLPCQASNNHTIAAVWWTRPDLKSEYVFYYRDRQPDTDIQNASFKGRVELADSELKDGNLSLVLKNVSSRDYENYTCGFKESKEGEIVTNESTCNITLMKPGSKNEKSMDGHFPHLPVGLTEGFIFFAVLLVAAVVIVAVRIYRRRTNKKPELSVADEEEDDQLM